MIQKNVTLTAKNFQLLIFDLKYPTHPLLVNKTDILTTFGFIHLAMTKDLIYEKEYGEVKTRVSRLACSLVNSYQLIQHSLKKHQLLKRLDNNKGITILLPDKNSGRVIVNIDDYLKKFSDIIGGS